MKKLIFITCFLFAFPILAFAHTTVSNSNPNNGEIITDELRELSIEFEGSIENQATLTLIHEQEETTIDNIKVEEKKITGILPSPLENGTYTLTWKVASTDGHIMSGDIQFTVKMPTEEKVEDKTNQTTETDENNKKETTQTTEEKTNLDANQETEDNSSLITTSSIVVLIILLIVGAWVLFRKKR